MDVAGTGLHGGRTVRVTLRPARAGAGIAFRPAGHGVEIEAHASLVSRVDHATTLSAAPGSGESRSGESSADAPSVRTVEHVLAALHGMGVDSCLVDVDGDEIPILDGSSAAWVDLIAGAGTKSLAEPRRVLRIVKPVVVRDGAASVSAAPADELHVTCAIDFNHPSIGAQEWSSRITPEIFATELAAARTFGFLRDVDALRKAGLARGASLSNAIVLDDAGVVSGPLRWADEFVRHKALDLVGDLALLGLPVRGAFTARRAGHRLHVELCRRVLADPSCYRVETEAAAVRSAPAFAAALR